MARKKKTEKWHGEWEPTADMRNFVRAMRESPAESITKLLETAGLSATWYYDVFQADPRAQEWYKNERERMFGGERLVEVHNQLYLSAITPSSTQHHGLKMYMQRFDPGFVERKELKQTIDVRLQNGLSLEDRLKVLAEAMASARGLPAAEGEEEFEGEIVAAPAEVES